MIPIMVMNQVKEQKEYEDHLLIINHHDLHHIIEQASYKSYSYPKYL